jgi:hypothetical protein
MASEIARHRDNDNSGERHERVLQTLKASSPIAPRHTPYGEQTEQNNGRYTDALVQHHFRRDPTRIACERVSQKSQNDRGYRAEHSHKERPESRRTLRQLQPLHAAETGCRASLYQ